LTAGIITVEEFKKEIEKIWRILKKKN
jgi:hypothetical protein